jgi:hypothetical protein
VRAKSTLIDYIQYIEQFMKLLTNREKICIKFEYVETQKVLNHESN